MKKSLLSLNKAYRKQTQEDEQMKEILGEMQRDKLELKTE